MKDYYKIIGLVLSLLFASELLLIFKPVYGLVLYGLWIICILILILLKEMRYRNFLTALIIFPLMRIFYLLFPSKNVEIVIYLLLFLITIFYIFIFDIKSKETYVIIPVIAILFYFYQNIAFSLVQVFYFRGLLQRLSPRNSISIVFISFLIAFLNGFSHKIFLVSLVVGLVYFVTKKTSLSMITRLVGDLI